VQTQGSPLFHALWMFVADLIAAGMPVIPFVFLPVQTAVVVALVVTGLWMALLGIVRGRIGSVNIWRSAVQTTAIAGAAALAGSSWVDSSRTDDRPDTGRTRAEVMRGSGPGVEA
jgi:VIT1/CCC1 family predicted Fe2+/Mn2+ transporter